MKKINSKRLVRFIAGVLTVLTLALPLAACGEKDNNDKIDGTNETDMQTENNDFDTTGVLDEPTETSEINDEEVREVKNILMIGNSNCYYYVEELCGIAGAAGKEINLCNLYYSGCSLEMHWDFHANDKNKYQLFHTTFNASKDNGRVIRRLMPVDTLAGALAFAKKRLGGDWDVISLQQTGYYTLVGSAESAKPYTLPYAQKLYGLIREKCPDAMLYWHQQWAYEVGYGANKTDQREHVNSLEKQKEQHNAIKDLAYIVAKEENVKIIPTGDAWQLACANAKIGQTLCARKGVNNDRGDCDHDGDIGGGQYLTACVWFEVLMRESCLGNTWRPSDYELSEEKIAILQNAAHEAVAAVYGEDYLIK